MKRGTLITLFRVAERYLGTGHPYLLPVCLITSKAIYGASGIAYVRWNLANVAPSLIVLGWKKN